MAFSMMRQTIPFSLKPEYVDEMTVDAETETKHKAGCVWKLAWLSLYSVPIGKILYSIRCYYRAGSAMEEVLDVIVPSLIVVREWLIDCCYIKWRSIPYS